MSRSPQSSRVSPLLGVLALCLTLFFVIAFVSQSLQARRLTAWRDSLAAEIESMERECDDLLRERERRESPEYAPEPEAEPVGDGSTGTQWFDNPNWYAWRRLVLGE